MSLLGGTPPHGEKAGQSDVAVVTERDFESEVILSEIPVLMEMVIERNPACKQVAPEVEAFAREVRGKIKVVKIDVEKAPNIARELRIQSVPTFLLFADRKIADAQVGALSRKQLHAMVEPFLPRSEGAIKPVELAQVLREGAPVVPVDTREAAAFKRAHLPGATHMPIEEIESRLAELHMLAGRPVLYCRSGDKTKEMAMRLADQGMPVAFLEGGLLGWEAEGLPIER